MRVRRALPAILAVMVLVLTGLLPQQPARSQGDPSLVGAWGPVTSWPQVAVHASLLPNNKVLFWAYNGVSWTLWDPVTQAFTDLADTRRYNPFCSGHSFLPDGRLFISGGHVHRNCHGDKGTYIFNPANNSITNGPTMNSGRWYPSNTTLPNGDQLFTSGAIDESCTNNDLPQVWQFTTNTIRSLTSARLAMTLYPRTFVAPNGQVFFATQTSRYLNTAGTGAWTAVGSQRVGGRENYGSAAMYDIGKIIYVGGGDPPTATAEVIDLNQASPSWTLTGSLQAPRRQLNVTILPDGTVLATAGSASAGFNTDDGSKPAELWDPTTGAWSTMAQETDYRGYHNTATLLSDGRVLSAGGDNHSNGQIFSPPYLFKGARPTITSAPVQVGYGQTFFVGTPDAVNRVAVTALSSSTHAQNWNQRYVPLSFASTSGGVNAVSPSSGNLAPPGPYLLWVLNSNGVPSVARFITIR